MATAKKKTTKKAAPSVKSSTKKTAAKKSTFFTLSPTIETFYWFILGAIVIALTIWVATLNMRIQNIYNQIEQNNAQDILLPNSTKNEKH